jgi:DNA adenine methylase
MTAPTRPVLRYHGGKWKLFDWVIGFFPAHRVYVEPFGGAASILVRKPRSYAEIYNELDGEVVNVFRVLRDPVTAERLQVLLELTPYARDEYLGCWDEPSDDPVEMARRSIIKSFMGFGSASISAGNPRGIRTSSSRWTTGWRANANRSGTTPAHGWNHWPDQVPRFVERLRGVVIENRDAMAVMATHDDAHALHYVDPPYVLSSRSPKRRRRGEYRHEMTDEQHRVLATVLHGLKGPVVLSGYPSALYGELYEGWERHERKHFADGATPRIEVVWLSPACTAALARDRAQTSLEVG